KINTLKQMAELQVISANAILQQVNKYAKRLDRAEIIMGNSFFGAVTKFNQQFLNISEALFGDNELDEYGKPSARDYIEKVEGAFR
ncbi:transcriptional regulator, partial [Escherichia coli]|nr:transcriptional regulator [Escherichia coli]